MFILSVINDLGEHQIRLKFIIPCNLSLNFAS